MSVILFHCSFRPFIRRAQYILTKWSSRYYFGLSNFYYAWGLLWLGSVNGLSLLVLSLFSSGRPSIGVGVDSRSCGRALNSVWCPMAGFGGVVLGILSTWWSTWGTPSWFISSSRRVIPSILVAIGDSVVVNLLWLPGFALAPFLVQLTSLLDRVWVYISPLGSFKSAGFWLILKGV